MVHYHDGVAVRQKGDKGPVTAADHASHAVIVEELAAWDSSIPIISEEGRYTRIRSPACLAPILVGGPARWHQGIHPEKRRVHGEYRADRRRNSRSRSDLCPGVEPAVLRRSGTRSVEARRLGVRRSGSAPGRRCRATLCGWRRAAPILQRNSSSISRRSKWPIGCRPGARSSSAGSRRERPTSIPALGPTMEWDVAAGDCIFRNSGAHAARRSSLIYNQPELRNQGFIVGLEDANWIPPAVEAA